MKLKKPDCGQKIFYFIVIAAFFYAIVTSDEHIGIKIVGIIFFTIVGILAFSSKVDDDDDDGIKFV